MKTSALGACGQLSLPNLRSESLLLPSSVEMARLDQASISAGTAAFVLMERAGKAVFDEIASRYGSTKKFLILCGPGNNGGDGLVLARLMREGGLTVKVASLRSDRYSEEWRRQAAQVPDISYIPDLSPTGLENLLEESDIIVDALLGTGQVSAPRGHIATILSILSRNKHRLAGKAIVAVDVPTGLNCDTGEVFANVIGASLTVSLEFLKRGMLQYPGREVCGELVVRSIGIPASSEVEFGLLCGESLEKICSLGTPLRMDGHKGERGHVFVVAGSRGMAGAAVLAAHSALHSGAGLVTRLIKPNWFPPPSGPELMDLYLDSGGETFLPSDLIPVIKKLDSVSSVIVGPGLGEGDQCEEFIADLLQVLVQRKIPTVIDAGALRIVAKRGLRFDGAPVIITPHPGEAAVLLKMKTSEVQSNRFLAARKLWEEYGAAALLKGAGTIVYSGKRGFVVPRGHPYMATAGSGDVLCGVIAPLLALKMPAYEAAALGAYIHGEAGENAVSRHKGPIVASQIISELSAVVGGYKK